MALVIKNLPANAGVTGDVGSTPESGRSPGAGNGNLLQYSCVEKSIDREAWQATVHGAAKSWTLLSYWAGTHTHTRTHTHAHAHTHARTHTRACTHTRAHTHTINQLFHNQLIGLFIHSTCIYWTSTICQSGKYLWTWTIQIPAPVEVTLWWRNMNNKEVGKHVNKIISHGTLQRKLKNKIGKWSERVGGSRWISW